MFVEWHPGQSPEGEGLGLGQGPQPPTSRIFPLKGPEGPVIVWVFPKAEPESRIQGLAGWQQTLLGPVQNENAGPLFKS